MNKGAGELAEAVAEYFEERAAVMEFCGELRRFEAEKRARVEAVAYRHQLIQRGWKDGGNSRVH
jgi:hypothetical protein